MTKTSFSCFTLCLLICVSTPLTVTAQIVNIPDSNLRAAIEAALKKSPGTTITANEMATLTTFGVWGEHISTLAGLENAINLTILQFGRCNISDLSPLVGLTNLTNLWLADNYISDLSPLAGLTNLTEVYLHTNFISDISPLANLTNLIELDLSGNSISDLLPLANLTNLTELGLSGNSISDLSPLANLTNLRSLGLGRNYNLTDVSPLLANTGLGSGTVVGIDENRRLSYQSIYTHIPILQSKGVKVYFQSRAPMYLKKISGNGQQGSINTALAKPFVVEVGDERRLPFEGVPVAFAIIEGNGQLSVINTTTDKKGRAESLLTLGPNPGTNAVAVAAARISDSITFSATTEQLVLIPDPNLRTGIEAALGKSGNDPITLSEISMLTKLQIRTGERRDMIRDLTGLEFATGLTSLKLGSSPLFSAQLDISPIAGLTNLRELSISNYSISDIAPIADLVNLTSLSLAGNSISDISAVTGLTDLTSLNLNSNSISNISAVGELTNLTQLQLIDNSLSDISPIAALINLKSLILADNSLSDISPITSLINLTSLSLKNNSISDIVTIADLINLRGLSLGNNSISDISAVANLVNLTSLSLENNSISDIVAIASLTHLASLYLGYNSVSDIVPITANKKLRLIHIQENPLSYSSIYTHIPTLQARRVAVAFNKRTPTKLINISGDQHGLPSSQLPTPFVVEVRDEYDSVFEGVPVTFTVTAGGGTLSVTHATADENGRAQSTLTLGPSLETNTVSVFATGWDINDPVVFNVIPDPKLTQVAMDVNGDNVVNVLDLVVVASELGNKGADQAADVNRDGVVNILDLVLVAAAFGDAAAAPTVHPQALEMPTTVEIQKWIADAKLIAIKEAILDRGIMVLERLLASPTPTKTELLPNYPNPFNPETWIPYQLEEAAFVTLMIYDQSGRGVRAFDLGHQIAAFYESRSKAIYWDGKNDVGEPVASGIYFYTLTAGGYSATRKMLIIK